MDKNKSTIKKLNVEGFKCIEKKEYEFRNLTILTGENSSGKSSLIQSILIAGNPVGVVSQNNDLMDYLQSLGRDELFNKEIGSKKIKIEVEFDNKMKLSQELEKQKVDIKNFEFPNPLTYPMNLTYLNAGRKKIQQVNPYIESLETRNFGIYGDLIANYYEHNKRTPLESYLIKDDQSYTLETQVNFWLKEITKIKNINVTTEKVTPTLIKNIFKVNGLEFLPENVGTGLSFLFAILVACLSAKKGNIIIIENPEIHLHPRSQAKLGEFLSFIASNGIQIIIETHNDHIINKICYEVYKDKLSNEDVIVHYFKVPYNEDVVRRTTLYIDRNGHWINEKNELIEFPEDFFDATLDDLMEMGG